MAPTSDVRVFAQNEKDGGRETVLVCRGGGQRCDRGAGGGRRRHACLVLSMMDWAYGLSLYCTGMA